MTTRNAFKFGVTLALAFAMAGGYSVFTAKASMSSASSVRGAAAPPVTTGKETLNRTKILSGSSGVALPTGSFVVIDGVNLVCPGPGTCTYSAENWLQVNNSATSNWAILTQIDGTFIGQGGPYLGTVGTDFVGGSWSDTGTSVPAGNHLVQTVGFMRDQPGTAFNYNFVYHVYKP
jgi:hypothetical protein